MKYYIEYYRHKNDKDAKIGPAFFYKEYLNSSIEASKKSNHITICYFIVKLKNHDYTSLPISSNSVNDSNPPVQERGATCEEHSQVLPEKWCVFNEGTEYFQCLIAYANLHGCMPPYELDEKHYFHFPGIRLEDSQATTSNMIEPGYTEISLEQFKKLVLYEK